MSVKDRDSLAQALDRAEAALRQATRDLERTRASLADVDASRRISADLGISEDAMIAFAQTARETLQGRALSVEAARRGALVAASVDAWGDELGPLLSSAQVRELLGGVSRQRVDELGRQRRIIGLRDTAGRRRFPSFQFHDARPVATLVAAYSIIAGATASEWSAASWCVAPDTALEGRSPAQWAREGRPRERLLRQARQDAARLAQ